MSETPKTYAPAGAGLHAVDVPDAVNLGNPGGIDAMRAGIAARAAPPAEIPLPGGGTCNLGKVDATAEAVTGAVKVAAAGLAAMEESLKGYTFLPERVEVELKFPLPTREDVTGNVIADVQGFRERLRGAFPECRVEGRVQEEDVYFRRPDQPLDTFVRMRLETPAPGFRGVKVRSADLTWKGPRLPGVASKSRPEETAMILPDAGNLLAVTRLLGGLGYRESIRVTKLREIFSLQYESVGVSVMLDRVEGIGHYVELEILTIPEAANGMTAILRSLADKLGLSDAEPRGYAELAAVRKAGK